MRPPDFSASPTGPPRSDPQTRAAKEDINWLKWRRIEILKKLMERPQREWKKCLNPDSNRDPPAYAAVCSPLSYWGLGPTREPEDILTISLQLRVRHTDATSAFSASLTGPPWSDLKTRAAKEDKHLTDIPLGKQLTRESLTPAKVFENNVSTLRLGPPSVILVSIVYPAP